MGESGYVWINDEEIQRLSELLKITIEEVTESYLLKVHHRYTINEYEIGEEKFACVFFNMESRCCTIYDARPKQCRTFPFWEDYIIYKDGTFYECPATSPLS